jgi:hypothetical protein
LLAASIALGSVILGAPSLGRYTPDSSALWLEKSFASASS